MYLLFDIGGTKMRLAVSRDGVSLGEPVIEATPQDAAGGIRRLAEIAKELSGGEKINAVAGGLAGTLDRKHTELISGPHIPGWVGKNLLGEFSEIFGGAKIFLENDAALAGLGEATVGAGKGKEIVAYITVSTGVGGARITHGKIDASAIGFEPGFQIIDADGTMVPGRRRLGRYISGTALRERFGKSPEKITDPKIQDELAFFLAVGLNNAIVHWSPDIVILGGSVMNIIPLERVRAYLKETIKPYKEPPPIEKATLGDGGGLTGALLYLKQKFTG